MIEAYFTDSITIYRPLRDVNNDEIVTHIGPLRCRVERTDRTLRGARGEEIQASYRIWLSAGSVVLSEDRVFLGIGEEQEGDQFTYPVLSVKPHVTFAANHLEVIV